VRTTAVVLQVDSLTDLLVTRDAALGERSGNSRNRGWL
jgi:hypothetical protein